MKFNRILLTTYIISALIISSFNGVKASDPDFLIKRVDGKSGTGNGEFSIAWDMILVDNKYYIADYYNDRVEIFDKDWNYLDQFGGSGIGLGQMDGPYTLYYNGTYIFVVETINARISLFKPNGDFVTSFGAYGTGNGLLNFPTGIVSDGERIYVSNYGNSRIEVFNASTFDFMTKFTVTQISSPYRLAVDHEILYLGESSTDSIVKLDKIKGIYRGNAVHYEVGSQGHIDLPADIQIINNHFVVVDTSNNYVCIFNMDGTFVESMRGNFDGALGLVLEGNEIMVSNRYKSEITVLRAVANPMNIKIFAGDNGIILSWEINQNEGATGVTSYNIYRDAGSGLKFIGETTTKSFSDISAKSGMNYTYAVEAASSIATSDMVNSTSVSKDQPDTNIKVVTELVTKVGNSTSSDGSFLSNLPVSTSSVIVTLVLIPILIRRKRKSIVTQ